MRAQLTIGKLNIQTYVNTHMAEHITRGTAYKVYIYTNSRYIHMHAYLYIQIMYVEGIIYIVYVNHTTNEFPSVLLLFKHIQMWN